MNNVDKESFQKSVKEIFRGITSWSLVGNLGTDFRNCGRVPQEEKKFEREARGGGGGRGDTSLPLSLSLSMMMMMKGRNKVQGPMGGQCAREPPKGLALSRGSASCSAQDWEEHARAQQGREPRAEVKS